GHPARAEHWMTEPPPWPPASIAKMLKRGEDGAALLETLTGELAPEADVRAWLLRSWLAPPRLVDGALLAELARAVDGRLGLEPLAAGEIFFNGRLVHTLPAPDRRVGFVFQDDALWPRLTVAENVGYALKVRRLPRAERREKVSEALGTLRIDSLAEKHPDD